MDESSASSMNENIENLREVNSNTNNVNVREIQNMRKGVVTEWISTPHSEKPLRGRISPDQLIPSGDNNVYIIKNGKRM